MAAHSDRYSPRCSCTVLTARSRTSGENLLVFFMAQSSQSVEPPRNPTRFSLATATQPCSSCPNMSSKRIPVVSAFLMELRRRLQARFHRSANNSLAPQPSGDSTPHLLFRIARLPKAWSQRHWPHQYPAREQASFWQPRPSGSTAERSASPHWC